MTDQPLVSIVMPIRNEAAFIARSLGAVLAQDYPPDRIEVLIADGMSDDDTRAIIAGLPCGERVHIIDNPDRLQAPGLNRVIPLAGGEIIIRLDGHTIIAPDYVAQCVRALAESGADNVGGAMDPVGITPVGKAIAAAGKSRFAVPSAFHVSSQAQFTDTVYLGAWPRDIFERVGLYNTALAVNEDYELNYRIRQGGGTIYFSPAIRSRYYGRQTFKALARQYYRYGRGKVQMLHLHPESVRPRQLIAPLFVAGLVVGPVLTLIVPILGLFYLAGVGGYALLSLVFARRAARRAKDVDVFRVMLAFLIIHLAWGAGFWRELLKPGSI